MNFCSFCGEKVRQKIPQGDNRLRYVCDSCHTIHYENPKIVTGCIPEWEDKILLCQRAIEPRYGLWTLPAGFMENGESNREGAARETFEEARAKLVNMTLFSVFSIAHINQIYTMYRGELVDGKADVGEESLDVKLVGEADIPWNELAFQVVEENLKLYYQDMAAGKFITHYGEILKSGDDGYQVKYFP